jgi:hypothetical protein
MSQLTQLDANQVIRTVYDSDTNSLQVVNTTVDTTTWLDAVAANSDHTTSSINILSYRMVGVMANWVSLDQANATLQFQGSLDDSVWDNVGSPTTLTASTDQQFFSLVDEPFKFMRLVYTHGTNTTGTITVKYIMRS